jgi:hypothetical protein
LIVDFVDLDEKFTDESRVLAFIQFLEQHQKTQDVLSFIVQEEINKNKVYIPLAFTFPTVTRWGYLEKRA